MKTFNFEVSHENEVLRGFVNAETKEEAINKIKNRDWDDIIDTFENDFDVFGDEEDNESVEDYEIIDIWE